MQFRPNQEVRAKKQKKLIRQFCLLRDGTFLEFPAKPEPVKKVELLCRNCYLNVLANVNKVKVCANEMPDYGIDSEERKDNCTF